MVVAEGFGDAYQALVQSELAADSPGQRIALRIPVAQPPEVGMDDYRIVGERD